MKDGEELEEGVDTEDEKSKLTLQNVKLSDSGNYTCHGDFDGPENEQIISIYVYGKPSLILERQYNKILHTTKKGPVKCHLLCIHMKSLLFHPLFLLETPSFSTTPTYHEFLVNDTAHIPCRVTGKPAVELGWFWNGYRVVNNGTIFTTGY